MGTTTIQQTSENKPIDDKPTSESSLTIGQNGHVPTPPPNAPTPAWTESETPQKSSKQASRKSSAKSRRSSTKSNKSLVQSVNIVNDNVIPDDVVQTDQKAVENIEPELVAEVPGSIESAEDAKSEKSVNEVEQDIQNPEEEAEKETV